MLSVHEIDNSPGENGSAVSADLNFLCMLVSTFTMLFYSTVCNVDFSFDMLH